MTTTLHLENTVHDFDSWKEVFDKFDRFRADNNVRSYRVSRSVGSPEKVTVDLDFDSIADAESFSAALAKVRTTPQSKAQLVDFREPAILELVSHRTFTAV
jgi:hypothetical protein